MTNNNPPVPTQARFPSQAPPVDTGTVGPAIGLGIKADDRALGSPINSVRRRLPWLLLSLGAALIAVAIVEYYVATIESSIWLAVLIPVVATMGSNAATQTMTVVVRGIGLGEVGWETTRRVVTKEALVGLIKVMTGAA